jgi:Protein of unknown function (DUF1353)
MASSFTAATWEPIVGPDSAPKRIDGRRLYRILGGDGRGFAYDVGFLGSGLRVRVPEGFVTDGPSIPSFIRWAVPKKAIGQAMKSAAVHDLLREDERFTLLEGDSIFYMCMEAEGTPAFWRERFFDAVRQNKSRTKRNASELVSGWAVEVARGSPHTPGAIAPRGVSGGQSPPPAHSAEQSR